MSRYRDGVNRSATTISAQRERQAANAQGYHAGTHSSFPDSDSQVHSGTVRSSNHEEHAAEPDQNRVQTHSSSHVPSSEQRRQQDVQQGHSSAIDPATKKFSIAQAYRGAGHKFALGAVYGRLSPRTDLQPLSDGTSVSINGTSYEIGGHYPDMSVFVDGPEDDDWLHEVNDSENPRAGYMCCDSRGLLNVGFLLIVCISVITLFVGWPVLYYANTLSNHALWGPKATALPEGPTWINVIDNNGSSQRTTQSPLRGLIDQDTPASAMNKTSSDGKRKMKLVFSDEFNEDGRTFFEGDDPYWTAVDLHYWQTGNYEWYTPLGATTKGGALRISLAKQPINNLDFKSAMLQSWNKLCIQGGYLEVSWAPKVGGYWSAVWMMANLGRAGYGATTEGMWPYAYDSCDVGTMPHQTYFANGTGGPPAAEETKLSFLPGQKLSRCTCSTSTDHPGPKHGDGSWMGRGASELDYYRNQDPYVIWMTAGRKSWTLRAGALGPDEETEVGQRLVPPEPMYLILNLGLSNGFGYVDFDHLKFPGVMSVDYVRFYQDEGMESLSCDGAFPEMPTVSYIDKYSEAYQNPNLTAWRGKRKNAAYGQKFPLNMMKDECS
ncbi:hypothetical protein CF336_g418 [Tilletia laevis]|uniref:GH16 domain-containing protein n=1 Tax=Tilletia caries TaxID=13290 RepID=A0ABN7J129_9BASI|nr:hypothetical protein CF336_g418 [Tilletia laevis]CAD6945187.1 unnamed protein product [Tilletia caries]